MKRASLAGPLIKSVIFIVITATVTAILGLSIAHSGVSATVGYQAVFSDVTGLTVGNDVDIAGVRVGDVTSISVYQRNQALVGFSVQSGRPLPASVTATIKYLNLVGQRYIELGQGTGPVGRTLPQGGTIPVAHTTPALDLTELFNGFQPLFQALSPGDVNQLSGEIIQVFQGESPNITALVASVGSLTTALATRDQVIGAVIDNLNSVLHTIGTRSGELSNLVTTLQQLVSGLAADRQPIGSAISAIASLSSATAGLLQVARAPLSEDITQLGRLAGNLANNTPTVNTFLQNLPIKMSRDRQARLLRLVAELLHVRRPGERRDAEVRPQPRPGFLSPRRGASDEAHVRAQPDRRGHRRAAAAGADRVRCLRLGQPADHRRRHRVHRVLRRGRRAAGRQRGAGGRGHRRPGDRHRAGRQQGRGDLQGEGRLGRGTRPPPPSRSRRCSATSSWPSTRWAPSAEPGHADPAVPYHLALRRDPGVQRARPGGQPDQHRSSWGRAWKRCPRRSPARRRTSARRCAGSPRCPRSIASRDDQLSGLLAGAKNVTGALAGEDARFAKLLGDGNLLLAELRQRQAAIHALLTGTQALAIQLSGLVNDNQAKLGPTLQALNQVTTVLEDNQANLKKALALAGPYYRLLGNALGNGRWFDTYLCGIVPKSYLPPGTGPATGCEPPKP